MKNFKYSFYSIAPFSIIRLTLLFTTVLAYTSYGVYNQIPWLHPQKTSYQQSSPWYPVLGPYGHQLQQTYPSYEYTTTSSSHHLNEDPSDFSQQQIVRIHDSNIIGTLRSEYYQEGNDFNIHNVNNAEIPDQELEGVASSKIETRKQKPKIKTKEKPKSRNTAYRNRKPTKSTPKRQRPTKRPSKGSRNKNSNTNHRRSVNKSQSRSRPKNNGRKRPAPSLYKNQHQSRRQTPQKRKIRPTRKANLAEYVEFFGNKHRRNQNQIYKGRRKSEQELFARQEDEDYGDDEDYPDYEDYDDNQDYESDYNDDEGEENGDDDDDEETTASPTDETTSDENSAEPTSTSESTESTTPPTEESTGNTTSMYDYGPSNGNENISFTYPPNMRFDYETPYSNYWYYHGVPNNFYAPVSIKQRLKQ